MKRSSKDIERDNAVLEVVARMPFALVRFKDIWNEVKNNSLFKSKRQLSYSLSYLSRDVMKEKEKYESKQVSQNIPFHINRSPEKKPLIKIKKTTKNSIFFFTDDAKIVKEILRNSDIMDERFPAALKEISNSRKALEPSKASNFFEALVYRLLANFLVGLEGYVRAPESLRDLAFSMLIRQNVDKFAALLVEMGKAHPEGTEQCLLNANEKLESLSMTLLESAGFFKQ